MPRSKRSAASSEDAEPRRRSSRLAAKDQESPAKEEASPSPKKRVRASPSKQVKKNEVKIVAGDNNTEDAPMEEAKPQEVVETVPEVKKTNGVDTEGSDEAKPAEAADQSANSTEEKPQVEPTDDNKTADSNVEGTSQPTVDTNAKSTAESASESAAEADASDKVRGEAEDDTTAKSSEISKNDITEVASNDSAEKPLNASNESSGISKPAEDTQKENGDTEDFEVVSKSDVPAPDSEEVKDAIAAQGADGQLLVNFVQVAKADVPAAESPEVAKAAEMAKIVNGSNEVAATNGGSEKNSS